MSTKATYNPQVGAQIERFLSASGTQYSTKGPDFLQVACPFHGGKSLGFWIHRSGRSAGCWKCETKTDWNGYAEQVHLPKLDLSKRPGEDFDREYLRSLFVAAEAHNQAQAVRAAAQAVDPDEDDLAELEEDAPLVTLPGRRRWTDGWRKLTPEFIQSLGCTRWYDRKADGERIVFPVSRDCRLVAWVGGSADPKKPLEPKYRNMYGPWALHTLFMLDRLIRPPYLLLVEGPYDTLRCIQAGIPAVGNFGAYQAWSDSKADQLRFVRVKGLALGFDVDEPGEKARDRVKRDLQGDHRIVHVRAPVVRRKGRRVQTDMGDAPADWLDGLRGDLEDAFGPWKARKKGYGLRKIIALGA